MGVRLIVSGSCGELRAGTKSVNHRNRRREGSDIFPWLNGRNILGHPFTRRSVMRAHLSRQMRSGLPLAVLAAISTITLGCSDPTHPAEPSAATSDPSGSQRVGGLPVRRVTMMDACDPTTFNAAIGPGTCVQRNGGVTFADFIEQVTKHGKVGSWHNAPPRLTAREGQSLLAVNRGGEVHTFTRVQAYGGGLIPILNQLSGNPTVAPECTQLAPGDFVPPGGTDEAVVGSAGVQRFMCCLHPWMRTTVHAH